MTLRSRWADDVDPDLPWPEYPRPQLRRDRWTNLNGPWEAAIHPPDVAPTYDRTVLVPFPVGSSLSGIDQVLQPHERLSMRRTFTVADLDDGERLLLHFGAVDQACEVQVDGAAVGSHHGGFDPFHFDITDVLGAHPEHLLELTITDPTDQGTAPLGKQTLQPFAIQYTAYAGVWQTVWLEPVAAARITSVVAMTDLTASTVTVRCRTVTSPGASLTVRVLAEGVEVGTGSGEAVDGDAAVVLGVADLRRWSPEDPFLYDLEVSLGDPADPIDRVESYFGAREVGLVRDRAGHLRLGLNGEPVFHLGLLDQGWWPDGLATAPTDEALVFDIEATKAMGFNTIRKHVKVEPARWYWHADRLGVLVWQDMPSLRFDMVAFGTQMAEGTAPPDMDWTQISPCRDPQGYRRELDAMLDALEPFPSIVVWVPFNESWGQHDTDETLAHVAARDPGRIVDGPSGWVDTGTGDLRDHHLYEDPDEFPGTDPDRAVVYGEYGGLKLGVEGHRWSDQGWGYETTHSADELADRYAELTATLVELRPRGLAGAIYTQTTDVETEINGLLTYDRAVFKIAPQRLREIHRPLVG